jgi:hypothetical protein
MACRMYSGEPINGMIPIYLENEVVKVGVLPDRGGDLFEIIYKPKSVSVLLRLDKPISNPSKDFSQRRDTLNQFEDHYYGGWQSIFPNSAPMDYFGAKLGQHGEIWQLPWTIISQVQDEQYVSLKMQVHPLRLPFKVEKTITLTHLQAKVQVEEHIVNLGSRALPVMWGQHIAFGRDLLEAGADLETNATTFYAEPSMPANRWIQPGIDFKWPEGIGVHNQPISTRAIPAIEDKGWSELLYLSNWEGPGTYVVKVPNRGVGVRVNWPVDVFKCLWFWQERYGMKDYPWWGQVFAVGLEPWTTPWSSDPIAQIEAGEWLTIESGASLNATIVLDIFDLEGAY